MVPVKWSFFFIPQRVPCNIGKLDGQRLIWSRATAEQALTALCASCRATARARSTALKTALSLPLRAGQARRRRRGRRRTKPDPAVGHATRDEPAAQLPQQKSVQTPSPIQSRRQSQAGRGHKQERTRHRRRTTLQRSAPTLARQRFGGVHALRQKDVQFGARRTRGPPQRRGPMLSPQ